MDEKKHDLQTVLDAIRGEGRWGEAPEGQKDEDTSSGGNVTVIAKRLGVQRQTIYAYRKHWVSVEQAIQDEREKNKDFVESQIMKRIKEGSDTMIIFYAKTQMKDRGYIERQEVTGKDGEPLETTVMTLEEWKQRQQERRKQAAEALAQFEEEQSDDR